MTDKYYNPFVSDMIQRVNKAVESANKNLDNALEISVEALRNIAMYYNPESAVTYRAEKIAYDALQKIAAIPKVKQKE